MGTYIMRRNSPCISQQHVRQALMALRSASAPHTTNPLLTLQLVEEALSDPALPHNTCEHQYILNEKLIDLICSGYVRHRQALGLDIPPPFMNQAAAEQYILQDGRKDNRILLGWSWLYFHYVRVDLNITSDSFCGQAGLDARTLRRYQQQAIARLTAEVIAEERRVRLRQRQRRLSAALPVPERLPLFGREQALAHFRRVWAAGVPRHLFVTGVEGIGKTALVHAAVREQIAADSIDYLVWVEQPDSFDSLRKTLIDALMMQRTALPLRDYAARYELLVVIDGLDGLAEEWDRLEQLLADLSTERVVLINRSYLPLRPLVTRLELTPLQPEAALSFLRSLIWVELQDENLTEGDVQILWQVAGGHPQAIRQQVEALRCTG